MNVKPELKQVTNYVAAFVGVVGNLLPILTPDLLTACGVSPVAAHVASSVAAALLIAYREKSPAVPPVIVAAPVPAPLPPESSK